MKPIFFFAVRAALLGVFLPLLLHAQDNCGNAVYNQRPGLPVYQNISFDTPIGPALGDPNPAEPGDTTGTGPERMIYFLHGFNGSQATWASVATATDFKPELLGQPNGYPMRKAVTKLPTFQDMEIDLDVAAGIVDDDLATYTASAADSFPDIDHSKAFIIAKSLGGLVARNVNRVNYQTPANPQYIHGIVTISTPHRGAPIISDPIVLSQFTNEACLALSAGPTANVAYKFDNLVAIASLVGINAPTFDEVRDSICNMISYNFLPKFSNGFISGAMQQIVPGSLALQSLNTNDSINGASGNAIPRVSFYGVEDGPEMWREFYHLVNNPGKMTVFEANDDDGLANFADSSEQHYYNEYISNAQQAQSLNSLAIQKHSQILATILLPAYLPYQLAAKVALISKLNKEYAALIDSAQECAAASPRWKQGYDWWASANDRYLTINGGLTVGLDTTYTCHCCWQQWKWIPLDQTWDSVTVCSNWQVATAGAPCTNSHPNAQCYTTQTIRVAPIHHDNDGMVPAWSSGNYPGLSINYVRRVDNTYYKPQYPGDTTPPQGANHEQINNSANTKMMMNDLLYGNIHPWFYTAKY